MSPDPTTIVADVDLLTPVATLRTSAKGRAQATQTGRMSKAAAESYTGRNRSKPLSKWQARQFIAWDGEGITDDNGRHRYVILANSVGDSVVNPSGVDTGSAFRLFLETARRFPQAVHVIFAGGYDVNMILSPVMTRQQARILADEGRVTLRVDGIRYRVTYHPRHTFEIREEVWNEAARRTDRVAYFCLWDVFGSFQASFVKACNRTLQDDDLTELAEIERMKGLRGSFTVHDMADMLAYCQSELRALVKLCESDRDSFEAAGFTATRWDGAGAKASAVLRQKQVGDHKRLLDDGMRVPVRSAYAGGRIECYRFGHHEGPMHTVDIRSAYPWAATLLPSLAGGTWEHVPKSRRVRGPASADEFSVWLVNYKGVDADTLHPLFWRSPMGNICYPQMTEGWYWAPEVHAAMLHANGRVKILDGYRFRPVNDTRPFEFVPRLFRARAKLEASRKGRGWPLKLALNSLYGKMAQQIGGNNGKPPRWHQLEWAGWITSKVRATMYDLAVQNVANLVSIQTDGLTFTGDVQPGLREGNNLGDFEVERFDAGTFVQSGIYWLRDGDTWLEPKVRGVGAGALNRDVFANIYQRQLDCLPPIVDVNVTRFRGLVTSCLTEQRWGEWCQWVTETRGIAAAPAGKRIHAVGRCQACQSGSGLHETLPTGGGSRSCLHVVQWESKVGRNTTDEWWLDTLDTEDSTDE